MGGQHLEIIQVLPVHHAVPIHISFIHYLRQVRLDIFKERQYINKFIQVSPVYDAVRVNVTVLEHRDQLAQPVLVIRRYPAVTVKVGYQSFVFGNAGRLVFHNLLNKGYVVLVYDTVTVNIHMVPQYSEHLLYIQIIYYAISCNIVLGELFQVYLTLCQHPVVYPEKFVYIGFIFLAVLVNVKIR